MKTKRYKFVHIYVISGENTVSNIKLLEKVFNENDDTAFVVNIKRDELPGDLKSFDNIYTLYQEGDKDIFYWLKNCEKCYFHFFRYDNKTYLKLLLRPWIRTSVFGLSGEEIFTQQMKTLMI